MSLQNKENKVNAAQTILNQNEPEIIAAAATTTNTNTNTTAISAFTPKPGLIRQRLCKIKH